MSASFLAAGSDGLDGVSASTGGLDGYGRYLEVAMTGPLPGAISLHFDNTGGSDELPGAVCIHLYVAAGTDAFPRAVSFHINDVTVGGVVGPAAVSVELDHGVAVGGADGDATGGAV